MVRSTFGGFTTAQLALRASQSALNVVGQNIANINTAGYTRQRVDLASFNFHNPNQYAAINSTHVGFGVKITGISQLRDPYLDIRFRDGIADVGEQDAKLSVLDELKATFDETGKNGIEAKFQDILTQLQNLAGKKNGTDNDSLIRSECQSLTNLLNSYATNLQTARKNLEDNLTDGSLKSVNEILTNIQELSKTIKVAQINGDSALELQDRRNDLIDQLATYANIEVKYVENAQVTGRKVDQLTINLIQADGTRVPLINDTESAAQFTSVKDTNTGKISLELTPVNGGATVSIDETNLKSGSLKGSLEMLNCAGDFDGTDTHGIAYYEKMLDSLANTFATEMNRLNGSNNVPLELFVSSGGAGTAITAGSIRLSDDWLKGTISIKVASDEAIAGGVSDDNTNINKIIEAFSKDFEFKEVSTTDPNPNATIFTGSFQGCYSNMISVLGVDIKSTSTVLNSYLSVTEQVANTRDGVSGVSLDEETMNLMQFQKSYNAAARFMTTLDEAMDTIINGMGVVGR